MATPKHHHELSAQCPSCQLHELVPVHLQKDEHGLWQQRDKLGPLHRNKYDANKVDVQIDACPVCFGAWFDAGELDTLSGKLGTIESVLGKDARPANRPCPHGHGAMLEHDLPALVSTPVDRCATCGGIWLDGHERRKLAKASTKEGQGTLTQRWLKRGAIWAAQVVTKLPVEVENPASGTPLVVYILLLLLLSLFLGQELEQIDTYFYGLVPGRLRDYGDIYTVGAHMFLHGSWLHLLGNMYFLYTFGDNIEHMFGHVRFALFFLVCGAAAGLIHASLTLATATAVVGASGAIAAVLGAYLLTFPHARLLWAPFGIQIKVPVWVYLIVWVGWNALMGFFGSGEGSQGVAWFAHVGGFVTGLALTPGLLMLRKREVARRVRVPAKLPPTSSINRRTPPSSL